MRVRAVWALWLAALLGVPVAGALDRQQVEAVRIDATGEHTRVGFKLGRPATFKLVTLVNPHRVQLDIGAAALGPSALPLPKAGGVIRDLAIQHLPGGSLRALITVDGPVEPVGTLFDKGPQLIVELRPAGVPLASPPAPTAKATAEAAPARQPEPPVAARPGPPPAPQGSASTAGGRDAAKARRPIVVVVDAGHGGHDPGAIGPSGLREKDVTLAISRRLVALLGAEPGMRGQLTRSDDRYLDLRQRMERARQAQADLFISIHADAAQNRRARGSTVYVLNGKGASDEAARRLAARENAALIGGIELGDKDPVLASVLLDLSQNAALHSSISVGEAILRRMSGLGALHRPTVQQAPFMVLKSPDVPSVLVETAYISNPVDERALRSARHQDEIAKAILVGVRDYFRASPPPRVLLAGNAVAPVKRPRVVHVIRKGETLSMLAQQYRVSVREIRSINGLRDDRIRVGQRLQIPVRDG